MGKRIEFIDLKEFGQLYKAEKDKTMKLALSLGFGSGLRISEIIGLEKDISDCCKAEVIREKRKIDGKLHRILICSNCKKELTSNNLRRKKGDWKIPPLTADMINLKEHKINLIIAKRGSWRTTVTPPNLKEEHLKLLPITIPRRTLQWRFDKLTMRVLHKKMSFHILRHGFGNFHANVAKIPLPMVQQLMGHSRIDTTGIYVKANPDDSIQTAWKGMGGE